MKFLDKMFLSSYEKEAHIPEQQISHNVAKINQYQDNGKNNISFKLFKTSSKINIIAKFYSCSEKFYYSIILYNCIELSCFKFKGRILSRKYKKTDKID